MSHNVQQVSSEQVTAAALDEKPVLIDVREENEWQAEHIAEAIQLSRGTIEDKIQATVPDFEKPIVCYCGGGNRSTQVVDNLQKMGYKNVHLLKGGLRAWKEAGLPTSVETTSEEGRASC